MQAAPISPSAAKAASASSNLAISTSYRPPASRLDVNGRSPSITSPMSGRRPAPLQPVTSAATAAPDAGKSVEERKEQEDDERLQERVMRAKRDKKKKRQTMPEKTGLRDVSELLNA